MKINFNRHRWRQRSGWVGLTLPALTGLLLTTSCSAPITPSVAGPGQATAPLRVSAPVAAPAADSVSSPGHVAAFDTLVRRRYKALGAQQQGLRFAVFEQALTGYLNLRQQGKAPAASERLAVIDFDLPSTEKRLWVLDLAANKVLFRTLVAHGNKTGQREATQFSNTPDSHMSSLGFYVTGSTYVGKHGRSLRLQGLDEGFNSNAAARAIVVHGAEYVSEAVIKQTGRLGRSQGCPALPLDQYLPIIDSLQGGAALFINKSDAGYASPYLDEQAASAALGGVS
ncbi:murein L,D-transpeptidase catalytic domain family protein [Hymenobacter sp. BT175]|uniref:murein L,D-transpeptidase catalytic domain family protein n=1 Tax=Hymenobacter translucens TaxID=2886507 RepID=UPI001D0ED5C2|nr:murein L,D-transpeptidase catalytic domain family protein [Hymenobacter translucens]MCC2548740.1 murein L,D-transpeptidase catalytic domain family protein [Hymenobacter translucens]